MSLLRRSFLKGLAAAAALSIVGLVPDLAPVPDLEAETVEYIVTAHLDDGTGWVMRLSDEWIHFIDVEGEP